MTRLLVFLERQRMGNLKKWIYLFEGLESFPSFGLQFSFLKSEVNGLVQWVYPECLLESPGELRKKMSSEILIHSVSGKFGHKSSSDKTHQASGL